MLQFNNFLHQNGNICQFFGEDWYCIIFEIELISQKIGNKIAKYSRIFGRSF